MYHKYFKLTFPTMVARSRIFFIGAHYLIFHQRMSNPAPTKPRNPQLLPEKAAEVGIILTATREHVNATVVGN